MNDILLRLIQLDTEEVEFDYNLRVLHSQKLTITYSGIAFRNLRILPETLFANISEKRRKKLKQYGFYKLLTEKKIRIDEKIIVLHHIWSSGYHHWICDCLLKILFIQPTDFILYIPETYPSFALESLSLFGFKEIRKIPSGKSLKGKSITLVTNPSSGHFDSQQMHRLRSSVLALCQPAGKANGERIFISRKNSGTRYILNEEQIHPILIEFGFRIIEASSMTFSEQAELFSRTEILLSNHGAGLTNCLFMPENSKIIELYREMRDDTDRMNLCYYRMAKALGHEYYCHFLKPETDLASEDPDRKNVTVNPELFKEFLSKVIEKKQ